MLFYNGKEIKNFQIDYDKVYHALAYDENNCPIISNEKFTEALNEFDNVCNDIEDNCMAVELIDSHWSAINRAEAIAFEVGIKFALGLITQDNLIMRKE